jgi:L,D-transpeptidase catalytic domain
MSELGNGYRVSRRGLIAGGAAAAMLAPVSRAFAAVDESRLRSIARRELSRHNSMVWLRDVVGIADYSRPSWEPRFFIVNMLSGNVKPFLVTHGIGSDPAHEGLLHYFSNTPASRASSRGAYLTHTWYSGKYGTSLRLSGLDPDNSNAENRAIVCHGAWYANPDMIGKWGKLGRSEGCFAFPEDNLLEIIAKLGPGRLIYADKL